jgi:hypothetical protein
MDINVNDDHTVGCAIAHAANAHLSNSDDSSHNDYGSDGSGVDSCYPAGLKPDSGGLGSVLDATEKRINHLPLQKHAIIFFLFLIS